MLIHVEHRVSKIAIRDAANKMQPRLVAQGASPMFIRKSRLFSSIALAALLVLACLFAARLQAQNISTAQLNGAVHDQTGAVIPNATVTIADASRGFSPTTTTDAQGKYKLFLLPP